MSKKYAVPSALLIVFSSAASADGLFLDRLEKELGLTNSLSAVYAQQLTPQQHQFSGDDCNGIVGQSFIDNGLSSGHRSAHCHVTEYDGGKVKSYFRSSPDGSYSTGFTWTFE